MGAVAGSGRDVSRVRWAGWSAAVAAALAVFGTGTAWLFMLWDSRTGPDTGRSALQGFGWGALAFGVVLPMHFFLGGSGRRTFGRRVTSAGLALLCVGTPCLAYSWSQVTRDEIMRERGVAHAAYVTSTWRTAGDTDKYLARVRLEDGREFTLEEHPRANEPRKYRAGARARVIVDPAGVVPPVFEAPPNEIAARIRTAGFAVVPLGSLLLAVPLGRRIAARRTEVRRSERVRTAEPHDQAEPRDAVPPAYGEEPRGTG
ncbi:hypothetical protein ACFV4Q_17705 [Streptomyces nojiriensis]|uniref:hypothetical protein n=1 Tax=Streptomyces nojiriensis TaxID=66374 RepID=UPI0036590451